MKINDVLYGFFYLIKVFSIDRLARSLQDLLSIIQLLQEKGVKIEFLS